MSWRHAILSIILIFFVGCSLNPNLVKDESSHVVCKVTFVQIRENTRLIYEFDGFAVSFTRINDGATRIIALVKESVGKERRFSEIVEEAKTEEDFTKIRKMYDSINGCNKGIAYF